MMQFGVAKENIMRQYNHHDPDFPTRDILLKDMTDRIKVKIGTVIETECGTGPVVAITKSWVIHEDEEGTEMVISIEDYITIPADVSEPDVSEPDVDQTKEFLADLYYDEQEAERNLRNYINDRLSSRMRRRDHGASC